MQSDPIQRGAVEYRIIQRVGTDADHHWYEAETGVITPMPRSCKDEPTWADALEFARQFNERHAAEHREMQLGGFVVDKVAQGSSLVAYRTAASQR